MWSICEDGLLSKYFHSFRTLFLHAYGYDYLPTLYYLQVRGLLIERSAPIAINPVGGSFKLSSKDSKKANFSQISKALKLTSPSEIPFDAKTASNPSYVFSDAYTPISCQIIAQTVADGWSTARLQKIFGQEVPISASPNHLKPDNRIKKALLIAFIGGVTFAEIAALRQFAQNSNFRLIVVASHILNREDFLKSFVEII